MIQQERNRQTSKEAKNPFQKAMDREQMKLAILKQEHTFRQQVTSHPNPLPLNHAALDTDYSFFFLLLISPQHSELSETHGKKKQILIILC
jgi:hypothetical protein